MSSIEIIPRSCPLAVTGSIRHFSVRRQACTYYTERRKTKREGQRVDLMAARREGGWEGGRKEEGANSDDGAI